MRTYRPGSGDYQILGLSLCDELCGADRTPDQGHGHVLEDHLLRGAYRDQRLKGLMGTLGLVTTDWVMRLTLTPFARRCISSYISKEKCRI